MRSTGGLGALGSEFNVNSSPPVIAGVNRMKNFDNSPLLYDAERDLYLAIRALPPKLRPKCRVCECEYEVSSLVIYSKCPQCGQQSKHRSFGGGGEIQDILLMALQWFAGAGVEIPEEFRSLVDDDWTDWDEHYAEEDD